MNVVEIFHMVAALDPILVGLSIFGVLLLCGFGLPLPEDIVLMFTGYACYLGVLPLPLAILIGMAGVLIGDSSLWWLGRHYGTNVLNLWLFKKVLSPKRLASIQDKYEKYHNRMLFSARFMPGLRSGIFLFAGWSGVPYGKFIRADGSAALISVPSIILATDLLGYQIDHVIVAIRGVEHWIVGAIVLAFALQYARSKWRRHQAAKRAVSAPVAPTPAPKEKHQAMMLPPRHSEGGAE